MEHGSHSATCDSSCDHARSLFLSVSLRDSIPQFKTTLGSAVLTTPCYAHFTQVLPIQLLNCDCSLKTLNCFNLNLYLESWFFCSYGVHVDVE